MPRKKTDDVDYTKLVVLDVKCFDARDSGDPPLGVLRLTLDDGATDFIVTEAMANHIIQELRDFLAEDAEKLP